LCGAQRTLFLHFPLHLIFFLTLITNFPFNWKYLSCYAGPGLISCGPTTPLCIPVELSWRLKQWRLQFQFQMCWFCVCISVNII
jgi:hypothetical protein